MWHLSTAHQAGRHKKKDLRLVPMEEDDATIEDMKLKPQNPRNLRKNFRSLAQSSELNNVENAEATTPSRLEGQCKHCLPMCKSLCCQVSRTGEGGEQGGTTVESSGNSRETTFFQFHKSWKSAGQPWRDFKIIDTTVK